jgi:hypothetical protein
MTTRIAGSSFGTVAAILGLCTAVSLLGGCDRDEPSSRAPLSFNVDIAPIIHHHCATCHRPGELAPFPLLDYQQVRKRAALVAQVTQIRYMPPWLPDSDGNEFVGQRGLSDADIALIQRWIDEGAVEGDASRAPEPPTFPEGWQLGEPDLVVTMDEPYILPGDGRDVFRNFVMGIPVQQRRYVRGVEFHSGTGNIIHHATMTVDATGVSRRIDAGDPQVGFDGMLVGESVSPGGHFLGWTPGKTPGYLHPGTAWRLDPGTDLVLQLHMLPSGKPESVQARVGLFFRIYPHAHYLASEMTATAHLPDGATRRLIHIEEWDFNWQDDYQYRTPIFLPASTRLVMEFTYDNSSDNVRNPSSPPRRIRYGPLSSDEMGDLWLQVLPSGPDDYATLKRDYALKEIPARIAGYEKVLETDPNDSIRHNSVGGLYLAMGQRERAREHFLQSIRIDPSFDKANNNLGYVYEREGKLEQAIEHYLRAVDSHDENYKAHNNLGNALFKAHRVDEAIGHYRKAIAANPDYAKAHRNLAHVLSTQGRETEARFHARKAEQLAEK